MISEQTPTAQDLSDREFCPAARFGLAKLIARRIISLVARLHPASMGVLIIIELLLLLRREQWTDLRCGTVHHRFYFLHGLPANRSNLRLSLIKKRLDFGLLIGRQVQSFS